MFGQPQNQMIKHMTMTYLDINRSWHPGLLVYLVSFEHLPLASESSESVSRNAIERIKTFGLDGGGGYCGRG